MNTDELVQAIRNLPTPKWQADREKYLVDQEAWKAQQAELEKKWKEWLGERYASDINTSGKDLIYSRAFSQGHSAGYYDIENEYIDLSEFASAFLNAALSVIRKAPTFR